MNKIKWGPAAKSNMGQCVQCAQSLDQDRVWQSTGRCFSCTMKELPALWKHNTYMTKFMDMHLNNFSSGESLFITSKHNDYQARKIEEAVKRLGKKGVVQYYPGAHAGEIVGLNETGSGRNLKGFIIDDPLCPQESCSLTTDKK